ncbi:cation:proton antiporter, partial [Candidatus Aminicenantes bacterium AC-708-M15]|nr:cation:proton antiporter [Candidatus Aminicenantes bacterium AC-708-M15]
MSILIIIVFFVLIYVLKSISTGTGNLNQSATFALGFLLITAFLFGKITKKLKLPMITGFMVMGIICGPYFLKLINLNEVKSLQLLDGLALSLIALTAGGELRLAILKEKRKTIILIILFQALFLLCGFLIFCFFARDFLTFLPIDKLSYVFAFGLLFGVLSIATSPSTTIAIITETRAKGPLTDLVLSITVFKDVIVIVLFAFSFSFSKFLIVAKSNFSFSILLNLLKEMSGSIITGVLMGLIIIFYLKFIKKEITIFILSIAFFTYELSSHFEF